MITITILCDRVLVPFHAHTNYGIPTLMIDNNTITITITVTVTLVQHTEMTNVYIILILRINYTKATIVQTTCLPCSPKAMLSKC
jgi:hypothetical protein